jgi:hypothetical protein
MPLINFPDVPVAPGVPNINRSAYGIAVLTGIFAGLSKYGIKDPFDTTANWQITDANGAPVILPDSVISFEYKKDNKVSDYPVENGSFSSYNKVTSPFDARIIMTCTGQGQMSREAFIKAIEDMQKSLNLYTIITPDKSYASVNLESHNYKRTSSNGVRLLAVECIFSEIRVTGNVIYSPAQPSGYKAVSNGNSGTKPLTTSQQSAFDKLNNSLKIQ